MGSVGLGGVDIVEISSTFQWCREGRSQRVVLGMGRIPVIVSTISHLSSFCLYLILMLCHMHKHLLLFTRTRIQPRVRI